MTLIRRSFSQQVDIPSSCLNVIFLCITFLAILPYLPPNHKYESISRVENNVIHDWMASNRQCIGQTYSLETTIYEWVIGNYAMSRITND